MKKYLFLTILLLTSSTISANSNDPINFYDLLWEHLDVGIEMLQNSNFTVVDEYQDEEALDITLERNNLSIKLFCYNASLDSIMEIMILTKDEQLFKEVKVKNINFSQNEFSLSKDLLLGYDADIYTNESEHEICFMQASHLYMISISESPTFSWRKEMFEEGGPDGKFKYEEKDDLKFHYRSFALIKINDGMTVEEKMIQQFGEIQFDKSIGIDENVTQIISTEQYQDYKKYVDENVLSNKKYKKEFLKIGKNLQAALNIDKNKYRDLEESENEILKVYSKNEWLYTLIMLDYLCEQILN